MTGDEVEQWRLAQGFTKSEAAEAIGVTRTTYRTIEKHGASKTQALAMEAVTMKRATIEHVKQSLTAWKDAKDHLEGFMHWTWAWGTRRATLAALEKGSIANVVKELKYNLKERRRQNQQHELWYMDDACVAYIEEHKNTLIKTLADSLKKHPEGERLARPVKR